MNAMTKLIAQPSVESGGLLGSLEIDLIIKLSLLFGALLFEVLALVTGIRIIAEESSEKKKRESQINKPSGESFQLGGRPLLLLGQKNLKPRSAEGQKRHGGVDLVNTAAFGLIMKLLKLLNNVVCFLRHKN
jgi:hypothetical protein